MFDFIYITRIKQFTNCGGTTNEAEEISVLKRKSEHVLENDFCVDCR